MSNGHSANLCVTLTSHRGVQFIYFYRTVDLEVKETMMENCSALWKVPPCIFDSLETVLPGTQRPIKDAKITFHRSSLSKCL